MQEEKQGVKKVIFDKNTKLPDDSAEKVYSIGQKDRRSY